MDLKKIQEIVVPKLQVSNCAKLYHYDLDNLVEAVVTFFSHNIRKTNVFYIIFFEDPDCKFIYQACIYFICYHSLLDKLAHKIAKDIDKIKPRIFKASISEYQCPKDLLWVQVSNHPYLVDYIELQWKDATYSIRSAATKLDCNEANSDFLSAFPDWVENYNCNISKISFKILNKTAGDEYQVSAADLYSFIKENILEFKYEK